MGTRKLAILDDYQNAARTAADWSVIQQQVDIQVFTQPFSSENDAAKALRDFDMIGLLRERTPFPASLIARLPSLKFICVTGTHNRTLDLAAAHERGITVSCTRSGSSEFPTTELTWALILAAARHLPQEDRALRSGRWQTTLGSTLNSKTLGIVGLGRIGRQVAHIGRAFGMNILAWSPRLTPERARESGASLAAKDELFSRSDVISLHVVLNDATRGLVGAAQIQRMKRGALLVNTSRGPLIDEKALIEALEARQINAALDVFHQEPLSPSHPLLSLDNVVLTPHLGFAVQEVYSVFYHDMVENISAYLAGRPIRLLDDPSTH